MSASVENQEAKLKAHYVPLVNAHGDSYKSVNWGSEGAQRLRFQVLCEIADLTQASVLDVGCGVGHFTDYLEQLKFSGSYQGIDAVPEMVATAQKRRPSWRFSTGNVVGYSQQVDYVIGSGLFYIGGSDQLVLDTVAEMFKACTKGVAFNSLSTMADQKEPGEYYANPATLLTMCQTITPFVAVRHDYMPHDFTVYLYKKVPVKK